jgi:hypothetical protein
LPSLEELKQHYDGKPFEVLLVDVEESAGIVKRIVDKGNYSFTVLLDMEGNVSKKYNVRSHPVKYLINRQGELVSVSLGYQDWASDKVKAKIDILMADPN